MSKAVEQLLYGLKKESKIVEEYEEYYVFLDDLRDCGITNMYRARPFLVDAFGLDTNVAGKILISWMDSYGERHTGKDD